MGQNSINCFCYIAQEHHFNGNLYCTLRFRHTKGWDTNRVWGRTWPSGWQARSTRSWSPRRTAARDTPSQHWNINSYS